MNEALNAACALFGLFFVCGLAGAIGVVAGLKIATWVFGAINVGLSLGRVIVMHGPPEE